MNIKFF